MKRYRLDTLIPLLVGLTCVVLASWGCEGAKAPNIPNIPAIVVTTDAELRSAIARVYDVLDATTDLVIKAKRFEEKFSAALPAGAHSAFSKGANDVLTKIKAVVVAIDTKALTTWSAIQARLQPILDGLNALLTVINVKGTSVLDVIMAAIHIVSPFILPRAA